jgi:hypothetical protein
MKLEKQMIELLNYIGNLWDALALNMPKIGLLFLALQGVCSHVASAWKQPADSFWQHIHNVVNFLAANYGAAKNAESK